jgi:hypothetical protein
VAIIGSASIQIRADDKYFEPDVRRAVAKIKNLTIQLRVDADVSKASKKIRDLRYRITSKDAVLKVDADVTKADAKMAALLSKFLNKEFNWDVKANTQGANTALRELHERYANRRIPFTATGNTAVARAALAAATRPRTVDIRARLDPRTAAALSGMFNTLTGTIPFEKIKGAITGVAANFESLAVSSSKIISVLGAVSAAALTTGANIFSIGGDITQVIGLAALMPAAFGAMATMLVTNKLAWDNFGDALTGTGKKADQALAKLPPLARDAVAGLKGTYSELQKPVQGAFWEAMGTSLQDTVHKLLPDLTKGLSNVSTSMGGLTKEALLAFGKLADGTLLGMLNNTAKGLSNLKPAIQPFLGALNTLGKVGATYLPQFGTYLANAGKHFATFIANAEKTGKINLWIETGVKRLGELGSVAKSTVGIFTGLTNAARMSGAPGLTEMANGMKNVAAVVNGEPFKSRLISILEGARAGSDLMGASIKRLAQFFGESSKSIGIFLTEAGRVGAITFDSIRTLFDGTGLGVGLFNAISGLGDALEGMKPGFRDLGSLLGNLGTIAGAVVESMGPGLNQLFDTLDQVVAGLKDGVIGAMPVLNEFVQSIMRLASGPVVAIADTIGNLLEVFAGLPGPVQIAIAAIAGFLILKPKLLGMFNGMRERASSAFGGLANIVDEEGNRARSSFGQSADRIRNAWQGVGRAFNGTDRVLSEPRTGLQRLGSAAGAAGRALGTSANQGLRMAGGGLMSMLGGPFGAALSVASIGVGMFAQAQADAAARVDALSSALDQQTGAATAASQKLILTDVLDLNATGFDDLMRSGRRNMEELAKATGLNMGEVSKQLSDPQGREGFINNWKSVRDAAGDGNDITKELAASVGLTQEAMKGLSQTDLDEMVRQFESAGNEAKMAEVKVKAVADAMGTNTIVAAQLSKNYETLKDATSSASDKFSALKQNLDLLNNGQQTARAASREYKQGLAETANEIKRLVTENKGVIDSNGRINDSFRGTLVNAKGTFSDATQGARDFSVAMEKSADGILKQGTAALQQALQQNKSLPEAQAAALAAMDKPMAAMRANLATLGFDAGQINTIMKQLGLDPEKLKGALAVDTTKASIDIARAALAADAFAKGNYTAVLAALPESAKKQIGDATGTAKLFAEGKYEAILDVFDNTPGGREAALAALLTYDGSEWTAFLKANNLIPEEVQKANDAAAKLIPTKEIALRANDTASAVLADVNAYVIGDKSAKLTANDQVSAVLATVNGSPLMDKGSQLTTKDFVTQMVTNVNAKQLNNKLSSLSTQDLVSRVLAEVNRKTLNGKSNTLTTRDLASIVVTNANAIVLRDKQNTLRTVVETVYTSKGAGPAGAQARPGVPTWNADGAIWNSSGFKAFANGGFNMPSIKSFARGGTENHVAQIARGAWPVRIWAEKETGGEAYIPLSKSKRPRSLSILEEVAKMFGMGLFKTQKFANGGTSGVTRNSSGGSSSIVSSSGGVSSALMATITRSLLNNNGGLNSIGQNIVDGIIGGVNNKRSAAVVAMKVLSRDLEDTVRTELDIHSPSKAFLSLGKYIVDGLAVGISTTASTAIKNMATLSNRLYVAASDVHKATGRNVNSSISLINSQRRLNVAWSKMPAWKYTDQIVDYYQKTGRTGNRTLADIVRARDDINSRLASANARLKSQSSARAEVVKDISSKMQGEFKLGTNILSDTSSYVPELKFSDVKTYTSGIASRLRGFNTKLQNLRKKGVSPALINEVAQLGSAEGGAVADALLEGSSTQIASLNADVAGISTLSTAIGNSTADGMYKAGIDATRGLVNGLTKDKNSLTQAANRISNTLVGQVKRNLGIRSPSRVFAEMGKYTTQGYIVGLDAMQPALNRRVDDLINVVPRRSTPLSMNVSGTAATNGVNTLGASSADPVVIQVMPSAGMDEEAVGKAAVRELNWQLISR